MDDILKTTNKYELEFVSIKALVVRSPESLRSPFDPIPTIVQALVNVASSRIAIATERISLRQV
ncbi:hypothetical protein M3484_12615 [Pseudomonas sp. GX19020]|uniref:hypothetical protein n=1 Tax=Pseudomonas sp. GX19020 TaxID=2942277 RepID=UPI0020197EF1|nr:hypothetical protein [Pseudomonas sp. GX19020]MCL4067414.1 hypothetical protein [Pseudomonas sp. GX19020]